MLLTTTVLSVMSVYVALNMSLELYCDRALRLSIPKLTELTSTDSKVLDVDRLTSTIVSTSAGSSLTSY